MLASLFRSGCPFLSTLSSKNKYVSNVIVLKKPQVRLHMLMQLQLTPFLPLPAVHGVPFYMSNNTPSAEAHLRARSVLYAALLFANLIAMTTIKSMICTMASTVCSKNAGIECHL